MSRNVDRRRPALQCVGCHKLPSDLPEYAEAAAVEGMTPYEYVWAEEGTLNRRTGYFLCTQCYIEAGCPSSNGGWTVPEGWRMPGRAARV